MLDFLWGTLTPGGLRHNSQRKEEGQTNVYLANYMKNTDGPVGNSLTLNKYAKAPAQQPVHPPPSVGDGCGCPRPRLGQVAHGCGFIEHLAFALGSCRLGWPPLGRGGAGDPRKV